MIVFICVQRYICRLVGDKYMKTLYKFVARFSKSHKQIAFQVSHKQKPFGMTVPGGLLNRGFKHYVYLSICRHVILSSILNTEVKYMIASWSILQLKMQEGQTGGASVMAKTKSFGQDYRATLLRILLTIWNKQSNLFSVQQRLRLIKSPKQHWQGE